MMVILKIQDDDQVEGRLCHSTTVFRVDSTTLSKNNSKKRLLRWKQPVTRLEASSFQRQLNLLYPNIISRLVNHFGCPTIQLRLCINQCPLVIDKVWFSLISPLITTRMEVEELLALLSTLGGGFSCLGERDSQAAHIAGRIAIKQLTLSKSSGDPNLTVRCLIYQVYSHCQRGKRRKAATLMKKWIFPFIISLKEKELCDDTIIKMYSAARHRIIFLNMFARWQRGLEERKDEMRCENELSNTMKGNDKTNQRLIKLTT